MPDVVCLVCGWVALESLLSFVFGACWAFCWLCDLGFVLLLVLVVCGFVTLVVFLFGFASFGFRVGGCWCVCMVI